MLYTIIFVLLVSTFGQTIVPIETGTVTMEDKFIRLNTCTSRTYPLTLTKSYYEQNPDISVIAAISSLKMDHTLSFHFIYNINCRTPTCQFELQFERFNPDVNPLFDYEVKIDFLIAHGLRTMDANMTYYKQIYQSEQNANFQNVILIPNGFSDATLTSNVEFNKHSQSGFVLSYKDPSGLENVQSSMGWGLNSNFILYKIVFLFHNYKVVNRADNLFAGFLQTKDQQINSGLKVDRISKEVVSSDKEGYSSYFYLPMALNEQFNDRRELLDAKIPQVNSSDTTSYLTRIIIGVTLVLILEMGLIAYRRKFKKEQLKGFKKTVNIPEILVSYNESFQQRVESAIKSDAENHPAESAAQMCRQQVLVA